MNKSQFITFLAAGVLGGTIAIVGSKVFNERHIQETYISVEQPESMSFTNLKGSTLANPDFRSAAKLSTPAVVHIKTYKKVNQNQRRYQDDFFRDFFGYRYEKPREQSSEPQHAGSGSGVIIDSQGFIATNNHVVAGADKIEVVLNDKRRYQAELVGTDPSTDLALLKIEEGKLPFISFANSENVDIDQY